MINDLDETLRQLLIQKAGLNPAELDISFDIPTRDWSNPVSRPTVNLYLFDVRENRELRELGWEESPSGDGKVRLKRLPLRIDLSYMVTCWATSTEDQHRLLWHVLETLFRHSPLPEDILQGSMRQLTHPVRTEVAQPDGVLKNVSDFWGALENQLRPAISMTVTLELDLNQIRLAPLTFAGLVRVGPRETTRESEGREVPVDRLAPGWEPLPVRLGGTVTGKTGEPIRDAAVRLIQTGRDGRSAQVGPTVQTDERGQYLMLIPPGEYTLIVEIPGRAPIQRQLTLAVRARGEPLPELEHHVEVSMPHSR